MNIEKSVRQVNMSRNDRSPSQSWWARGSAKIMPHHTLRSVLKISGWVVFSLYISGFVTMLSRRAATFPVALAESSDAANAMSVLRQTQWSSDNGYRYYGPLYYRLAKSLLKIDPVYRVAKSNDINVRDKASHIALMLTSFIALVALVILLGAMVGPDWSLGWLSCLFLFGFLSSSEMWIDFTVDNHPDLLLTTLVALATASTIKSLRAVRMGRTRFLWLVGAIWGGALLTKLSAVTFFASALALIGVAAWQGRCFIRAAVVVGMGSLLTYLGLGFPQALKVGAVYKSMRYVASVTIKTFDWVFWKGLLADVSVLPLLILVGSALVFVREDENPEDRTKLPVSWLWLALMIPGISFGSLFWLSYQDHMRHYILPVAAALAVVAVPLFKRGALLSYRWFPLPYKPWLRVAGAVILVLVIVKGNQYYRDNTTFRVVPRFQLIKEAEMVQMVVQDHLAAGKSVVSDPFVPIDIRTQTTFAPDHGFTAGLLGQFFDAETYVSSRWYHDRFLKTSPSPWILLNLSESDYRQRHDFYSMLEKDSFKDGSGRTWEVRLRTPLGWAIWENVGDSSPITGVEINRLVAIRNGFLKHVLLDLDFLQVMIKDRRQMVSSKSGQSALVDGPATIVPGPRPDQKALLIQSNPPCTRLTPPPSSISLKKGTFATWARITNSSKGSSILLSVNSIPDTPRSIYLERYANGRFSLLFNGHPIMVSDAFVRSHQWHHYVFTWDEGNQRFYIDGRVMGSSNAKSPMAECRSFSVGWLGENNDESQWPGPLAEIVTLNRPLSAEEVTALHRIGLHGKPLIFKE